MRQIGAALEMYSSKHTGTYAGALLELMTDNDIDDTNVLNCPVSKASYLAACYVAPSSGTSSNAIVLTCTGRVRIITS